MGDQVLGVANGVTSGVGVGGAGLGTMTGVLQGGVGNLLNIGHGYLDRWFPPAQRESAKAQLIEFATKRPKLAAFLLSQLALSGLPLLLFVVMTITIIIFSLVIGLLVGLLGAVFFILFALGVALFVLLPTLFLTTFAGVFIFLFGIGTYYIVKWFNEKSIPGIHTGFKEGIQEKMGLQDVPALNGEAPPPAPAPVPHVAKKSRPPKVDRHPKPAENGEEEKETKSTPRPHKESPNTAKKQHSSPAKPASSSAEATTAAVGDTTTNALGGAGGELRKKTAGLGV